MFSSIVSQSFESSHFFSSRVMRLPCHVAYFLCRFNVSQIYVVAERIRRHLKDEGQQLKTEMPCPPCRQFDSDLDTDDIVANRKRCKIQWTESDQHFLRRHKNVLWLCYVHILGYNVCVCTHV